MLRIFTYLENMFKNPDFKGVNQILFAGIFFLAFTVINVLELFTEPWFVPRLFEMRGARYMISPITVILFFLIISFVFLLPALYIARKKCRLRIKNKEVSAEEGFLAFKSSIIEHIVLLAIMIVAFVLVVIAFGIITTLLGFKI